MTSKYEGHTGNGHADLGGLANTVAICRGCSGRDSHEAAGNCGYVKLLAQRDALLRVCRQLRNAMLERAATEYTPITHGALYREAGNLLAEIEKEG